MLIAFLSVACAHAAADAFHPWGLNDSKAFVFPRIAEKRNRGRRERLAAALRMVLVRSCTNGRLRGPAHATRARSKPDFLSSRR